MFTPFNPRYKVCWFYVGLMVVCMLAFVANAEMGLTESFGELAMKVDIVTALGCAAGLCVEACIMDNKKQPQQHERARQWTEDEM